MNYIDDIAVGLAALHVLLVVIVNLTPTPKDNEWLQKIYRVLEIGAGIVTKTAKQTSDKN